MNSDQLILRETTNAPLITKGDYINSSEFDQNLINIYNDFVALCNTSGVIAFDIDTTYDDAINQFATFNGRLYRWINSAEGSGVTPSDEGASDFWLEIFPTDLSHRKNSDTILAEGTVNEVSAAEIKAFIAAGLTSTTDLSISARTSTGFTLNSSTGADVTIPQATATEAGLLNAEDKGKLQRLSGNNTGDQTLESLGAEAVSNKAIDFATLNDELYPTVQATETRIGERIDELKGAPPVDLDTLEKMADAISSKLDSTSILEDLANIQAGATDGQYLQWNDSLSLWVPATLSSGLTIGATTITSGTNNRVLYQASGKVSQSSALTFDGTLLTVGNSQKILSAGLYPSLTLENSIAQNYKFEMYANTLYMSSGATTHATLSNSGLSIGFGYTGASAKVDIKSQGSLSTDVALRVRNSADTINFLQQNGDGTFTQKDSSGTNRINLTTTDSYLLYNGNNFIQFGSANRIYSAAQLALTTAATTNRVVMSIGNTYNYSFYKGTFQINTNLQDSGTATNSQIFENGTAPSSNLTNHYWQYSADIVAGNAAPHFRTETGDIIKLYKQSAAGVSTVADIVTVLTNLGLLA